MIVKERLPALRWWTSSLRHVFCHRGLPDVDAELEQFAVNAGCTPERVGGAHLVNKPANFSWDCRPATPRPRFPEPIGSKTGTMPADYGFRFDDLQCVHNIRSERIKPGKHKPVDATERDATGISPAKHIQLVPEH